MPNVKAKADRRQGYRPNPRRQVIWVVVVLVAVLAVVGADEARTDTSAFTIALTAAPAGETPVIAIVDTGTGKVRSCWLTGPVSKPNCSQWSD